MQAPSPTAEQASEAKSPEVIKKEKKIQPSRLTHPIPCQPLTLNHHPRRTSSLTPESRHKSSGARFHSVIAAAAQEKRKPDDDSIPHHPVLHNLPPVPHIHKGGGRRSSIREAEHDVEIEIFCSFLLADSRIHICEGCFARGAVLVRDRWMDWLVVIM